MELIAFAVGNDQATMQRGGLGGDWNAVFLVALEKNKNK
jgi:hypothetical protein